MPSSVCVGCGVRLQVRKAERLFSAQKRCTLQRAGSTAIDLRSDSLQTRNACGVGFIPASKMNPPQRGAPAEKASSAASSLLSQAKRLLQEVASEKSEGEKDQDWLAFQKASAAAVEGADEEEKEAEPPPPVCQRCFSLHVGKRISEDLVSGRSTSLKTQKKKHKRRWPPRGTVLSRAWGWGGFLCLNEFSDILSAGALCSCLRCSHRFSQEKAVGKGSFREVLLSLPEETTRLQGVFSAVLRRAVFLLLIDSLSLLVPEPLLDALGSQPVLIAVNKVDLLPRKQVGVQRAPSVRVRAAVLDTLKRLEEKRGKRLNLADGKIHLVRSFGERVSLFPCAFACCLVRLCLRVEGVCQVCLRR